MKKHAPNRAAPARPIDSYLHFVGVGGSGMSGLAKLFQQRGATCSGSDLTESEITRKVAKAGVRVVYEQTAAAVPERCDTLVISAAIKPDHPEVVEAQRRGIEVVKYAQMLGRLMDSVGTTGVALAGTHGKSTTTAILCHILIEAELDPSFILGAHCGQIGGGSRVGNHGTLIAEACEYDRSFHHLHPTLGVILNIEADHLDLYSGIEEIVESFVGFAKLIPPADQGGFLLIHHESPHRLAVAAGLDCEIETLGFAPQADWYLSPQVSEDSEQTKAGRWSLHHESETVCTFTCPMPGDHFAYNASAAAILAHRLGADWQTIERAIAGFAGLDRRMQFIGRVDENLQPIDGDLSSSDTNANCITLIDDYGHHPTEIDTTLRALRQHYRPARLICVFQPHQHSRTRHLMEQFAVSFEEADIVIVPKIFFVRDSDEERRAVDANDLVDRLCQQGVSAMHLHPFQAIVNQLQLMAKPGDLVVTMGAGDVWKIGRAFLSSHE